MYTVIIERLLWLSTASGKGAYKNTHEWAAAQQTMHAAITSRRKASGIAGVDTSTVHRLKICASILTPQCMQVDWGVAVLCLFFLE